MLVQRLRLCAKRRNGGDIFVEAENYTKLCSRKNLILRTSSYFEYTYFTIRFYAELEKDS